MHINYILFLFIRELKQSLKIHMISSLYSVVVEVEEKQDKL